MLFEVTFTFPKPKHPKMKHVEPISNSMTYLPNVGDYISFENIGTLSVISITHNLCKAYTNDPRNFVTIELGE